MAEITARASRLRKQRLFVKGKKDKLVARGIAKLDEEDGTNVPSPPKEAGPSLAFEIPSPSNPV